MNENNWNDLNFPKVSEYQNGGMMDVEDLSKKIKNIDLGSTGNSNCNIPKYPIGDYLVNGEVRMTDRANQINNIFTRICRFSAFIENELFDHLRKNVLINFFRNEINKSIDFNSNKLADTKKNSIADKVWSALILFTSIADCDIYEAIIALLFNSTEDVKLSSNSDYIKYLLDLVKYTLAKKIASDNQAKKDNSNWIVTLNSRYLCLFLMLKKSFLLKRIEDLLLIFETNSIDNLLIDFIHQNVYFFNDNDLLLSVILYMNAVSKTNLEKRMTNTEKGTKNLIKNSQTNKQNLVDINQNTQINQTEITNINSNENKIYLPVNKNSSYFDYIFNPTFVNKLFTLFLLSDNKNINELTSNFYSNLTEQYQQILLDVLIEIVLIERLNPSYFNLSRVIKNHIAKKNINLNWVDKNFAESINGFKIMRIIKKINYNTLKFEKSLLIHLKKLIYNELKNIKYSNLDSGINKNIKNYVGDNLVLMDFTIKNMIGLKIKQSYIVKYYEQFNMGYFFKHRTEYAEFNKNNQQNFCNERLDYEYNDTKNKNLNLNHYIDNNNSNRSYYFRKEQLEEISNFENNSTFYSVYLNANNFNLITDKKVLKSKLNEIFDQKDHYIGFDMEWYSKEVGFVNKPSLIQLATLTNVYIIDMRAILAQDFDLDLEEMFFHYFTNFKSNYIVGHSVHNDLDVLNSVLPTVSDEKNLKKTFIDIQKLFKNMINKKIIIEDLNKSSLSYLAEKFLGKPLEKSARMSNWNIRPLSAKLIKYAAIDSIATLKIFYKMNSLIKAAGFQLQNH